MRRESSRGERSKRSFTLGEFACITMRNSFYWSYFLFADTILRVEMLWLKFPAVLKLSRGSVRGGWGKFFI